MMIIIETYKFNELDNGDILLQKIIIDTTKYIIINKDNDDKLLKKIFIIDIYDIEDIKEYNFTNSIINECFIDNKEFNKLKYNSILVYIYKLIDDGIKIIKNTNLNIKTIKKLNDGFYYLDSIGISVQRVDSNKCLLEIINQCNVNNLQLFIKIKLINEITMGMEKVNLL